jgi:hypothetical protein
MVKGKEEVKIACTMIVKDNSEIESLELCLESIRPHVDGLYVAVTGPSGLHDKVHELVKKFDVKDYAIKLNNIYNYVIL